MVVEGKKRGHTFAQPDLFIAAIAALQDLVVESRNVSEFGVRVFLGRACSTSTVAR
jgi:hypothetical protein